jgi:hypothetical protein
MIETPILVVLLFGLGALSLCGMVIYAASMRAMMPRPMPDITRFDPRNPEYGRPMRDVDFEQLYQRSNQLTNLPSPQQQEMK